MHTTRRKETTNWIQHRTARSAADANHANTGQIYGNHKRKRKPREKKTRSREKNPRKNKTARRQHRRSRRSGRRTKQQHQRQGQGKQGRIVTTKIDQKNKGHETEKQHTRYTKEWEKQEQQKERNQKEGTEQSQKGYMSSLWKPRQPRTTQENKDGALRYGHETNTWQCARCAKNYSGQNARSARIHAAAHTRAEKKRREEQEANIIQHYIHQNQDEVRIKTLRSYGSEHRNGEIQENTEGENSTSRNQNSQSEGKEGENSEQTEIELQKDTTIMTQRDAEKWRNQDTTLRRRWKWEIGRKTG